MRNMTVGGLLFLAALCVGCGSSEPGAASQDTPGKPALAALSETGGTGSETNGLVSSEAVAACGGFGLADAAAVLDVPVEDLEDRSEASSEKLNLCSFMKSGSMDGLGFYLSVSPSVERAVAEMEQGRGVAGVAAKTIGQVTGTEDQEAALGEAEGIGEEAYFMEVNGTLNVRVGNVQIQVFHTEDREQMKQVGRMVAAGLRQS